MIKANKRIKKDENDILSNYIPSPRKEVLKETDFMVMLNDQCQGKMKGAQKKFIS
jgi:hypothetical protein